jgi:chemotaxis protein methyltransferase CheR
MTVSPRIDETEFQLMRDYIEKICGIHLTKEKMYLVETRLTTLMVESGCDSFADLYHSAASDSTHKLRDRIIEAMTTNETSWFRDEGPFTILDEVVFPELAAEIRAGKRKKIKIWSAACSTGQEAYSIAMTLLEYAQNNYSLTPEHVEILASDISSTVLYLAMAGRYDSLAISRGLPDDMRDRYFDLVDNVWAIKDNVKRLISYKKINLQDNFSLLGAQDIVFCRNVLIYFSEQFKSDILLRIAGILNPKGSLFVGASESVLNYSPEYQMIGHARGIYYKLK